MTLFDFIKRCLHREAVRTEPDCTETLQKILTQTPPEKEREQWKNQN